MSARAKNKDSPAVSTGRRRSSAVGSTSPGTSTPTAPKSGRGSKVSPMTTGSNKKETPGVGARKRALSFDGGDKQEPTPKRRRGGRHTPETDKYCWHCHKEDIGVSCVLCPRSFHLKCLNLTEEPASPEEWMCVECEQIMKAECVDSKSKSMSMLTIEQLCTLLVYAIQRMKKSGNDAFLAPVDISQVSGYMKYIVYPMDLSVLERNIKKKMYGSTEAFHADAKWILHNCIVFNGTHHKLTNSAKNLLKICRHEMSEIELCPDCYRASCLKTNDHWFCEPCRIPHVLVYAKLKGYPFWPAKVLQETSSQVDVRFFGQHDRAWVPITSVYMLSKDPPTANRKKTAGMDESIREVEIHIQKLKKQFHEFNYAAPKTLYQSKMRENIAKTDSRPPSEVDPSESSTKSVTEDPPSPKSEVGSSVSAMESSTVDENGVENTTTEDKSVSNGSSVENSPEKKGSINSEKELQDVDNAKVAEVKDVDAAKVAEVKDVDNAKVAEVKDVDAPKVAEVKDVDNAKVAEVKDIDNAKVTEVKDNDNEPVEANVDPQTCGDAESTSQSKSVNDKVTSETAAAEIDSNSNEPEESTDDDERTTENSTNPTGNVTETDKRSDGKELDNNVKETDENCDVNNDISDRTETGDNSTKKNPSGELSTDETSTETQNIGDKEKVTEEDGNKNPAEVESIDSEKEVEKPMEVEDTVSSQSQNSKDVENQSETSNDPIAQSETSKEVISQSKLGTEVASRSEKNKDANSECEVINETSIQSETAKKVDSQSGQSTAEAEQSDEFSTDDENENAKKTNEVEPMETDTNVEDVSAPNDDTTSRNSNDTTNDSQSNEQRTAGDPEALTRRDSLTSQTSNTAEARGETNDCEITDAAALPKFSGPACKRGEWEKKQLEKKEQRKKQNNLDKIITSMNQKQASSDSHDVVEIPDDDVPAEEEAEASADVSPVDVGQYTTKLMQTVEQTLNDLCAEVKKHEQSNKNVVNHDVIVKMQLELDRLQWQQKQEIVEIKHNTSVAISEMKAGLEKEHQQTLTEVKRNMIKEKNKAVMDTKKKQWCAMCNKEALFYCCWNTSYCDYPCQQSHWPVHMGTCTQSSGEGGGNSANSASSTPKSTSSRPNSTGQKSAPIPTSSPSNRSGWGGEMPLQINMNNPMSNALGNAQMTSALRPQMLPNNAIQLPQGVRFNSTLPPNPQFVQDNFRLAYMPPGIHRPPRVNPPISIMPGMPPYTHRF